MTPEPAPRRRPSLRLPGYDYSQPGAYFITIVTRDKECLFGEVVGGTMELNKAGRLLNRVWDDLPDRFPSVGLDRFVIMPNHMHALIVLVGVGLAQRRGRSEQRPYAGGCCAGAQIGLGCSSQPSARRQRSPSLAAELLRPHRPRRERIEPHPAVHRREPGSVGYGPGESSPPRAPRKRNVAGADGDTAHRHCLPGPRATLAERASLL